MLRKTANFEAKNAMLFQAIQSGDLDQVKLFADRQNQTCTNAQKRIPIHVAAYEGHWNIVDFLLSKLEESTTTSSLVKSGLGSVLLYCIHSNEIYRWTRSSLVPRLLALGAETNHFLIDNTQNTTLHVAAANGHSDIVSQLLNAGADLNAKNKQNRIALELAIENHHSECRDLLLHHAAEQSKTTDVTNSPTQNAINQILLQAAEEGNLKQVKLFVSENNQSCLDSNNNTPIHLAACLGHWDVVEFLLSKLEEATTIPSKIKYALGSVLLFCVDTKKIYSWTRSSLVQRLLALGAEVDHRFYDTLNTPLHVAADHGYSDIVSQLLNAGADLNAKNKEGKVALELAVKHSECIKLLTTFEKNKLMDLSIFALICLSDNTSSLRSLPLDVIIHISNFFPENPLLSLFNFLSQSYESVSYKLTLISAKCALNAYEHINSLYVPIEIPVPFSVRSNESLAFFTEKKSILSDNNKTEKEKAQAIMTNIKQYRPEKDCRGLSILKKFHLWPAIPSSSPDNLSENDFHMTKASKNSSP